MNIDEIIRQRRSTFTSQFSGDEIDPSQIDRLLSNANWAPNHLHTEPWRFVVYSGGGMHKLMDQLALQYKETTPEDTFSMAKFNKYDLRKSQISHAIVIASHISERPDLPEVEEICATACAVQNLWLTLSTMDGIGGYWSTGHLVYQEAFSQFVGLQKQERCLGIFYLGVIKAHALAGVGQRNPWQDKVKYISK